MRNIDDILKLPTFSKTIGLDRAKDILFHLHLNRCTFPWIHIAGTKGKGSTSVFIANVLHASGYKVGLFLSPHLQKLEERISINLETLDPSLLSSHYNDLRCMLPTEKWDQLNYFETLTILAFYTFTKEKVEVAVFETGLGGRLDATNCVENPILTVLSTLGYDHTERLGTSLSSITYEKAGIMKTGVPIISASQEAKAAEIIKKEASLMRSKYVSLDNHYKIKNVSTNIDWDPEKFCVTSCATNKNYPDLQTFLLGKHQIQNAALALASAEELKNTFPKIDTNSIREGITKAFIPGRFEHLIDPGNPNITIIVDGAHNPESAKMLTQTLKERFSEKKIYFLVGILKNKQMAEMVQSFLEVAHFFQFTTIPYHDTYKEQDYENEWEKQNARTCFAFSEDWQKAYDEVSCRLTKNDVLCICGSLYLVGQMRESFHYKACSSYERKVGG
jgi:dihydrofolate synthase/folylpolyglutamate synthase